MNKIGIKNIQVWYVYHTQKNYKGLSIFSNFEIIILCKSKIKYPVKEELEVKSAKQKRSTEGCSKFISPETRQVQERLVSTLEQM